MTVNATLPVALRWLFLSSTCTVCVRVCAVSLSFFPLKKGKEQSTQPSYAVICALYNFDILVLG